MKKIMEKIKQSNILDQAEYEELAKVVNRAMDNAIKKEPLSEKFGGEIEEEIGKDMFPLSMNLSCISHNASFNNIANNMDTKTDYKSKKGKEKSINSSIETIRGRNFIIQYPKETPKNEIEENLKYKLPNALITEVDECVYKAYRKNKMSITSLDGYKIGKSVPIIRTFSSEMLKDSLKKLNYEKGGVILGEFLKNPCQETSIELEKALKASIGSVYVLYHSEYILSCIFFGYVNTLGIESSWNKMQILSVDSKMQSLIGEDDGSIFRCDMLFVKDECLVVVEFKYKFNRPENMAEEAIRCIQEKGYVGKACEFIQVNYPQIFKKIKRVLSIGIGYNVVDFNITCNLKFVPSDLVVLSEEDVLKIRSETLKISSSRDLLKNKRRREKRKRVSIIIKYLFSRRRKKKWRKIMEEKMKKNNKMKEMINK